MSNLRIEDLNFRCSDHPQSYLQMILLKQGTQQRRLFCLECFCAEENRFDVREIIPIATALRSPVKMIKQMKNDENIRYLEGVFEFCSINLEKESNDQIVQFDLLIDTLNKMKQEYKTLMDRYLQIQQNLKNYCDQFLENCQINTLRNLIFELQINSDEFPSDKYHTIQNKISNTLEKIIKEDCSLITSNIHELKLKHRRMNINNITINTQDFEQKLACFLKKYNEQLTKFYSTANSRLFNVPALKVLDLNYFCQLEQRIQLNAKRQIQSMTLLFLGSRDGLNEKSFWCKINQKSHLLMAFRSNNKGKFVFGGYSPCQWKYHLNNFVEDPTGTSFLFSKTHNEIYSLQDEKKYAIHCNYNNGPTFGEGPALSIAGNFIEGNSKLGQTQNQNKGSSNEHLFGGAVPNIEECEIYQLQFE